MAHARWWDWLVPNIYITFPAWGGPSTAPGRRTVGSKAPTRATLPKYALEHAAPATIPSVGPFETPKPFEFPTGPAANDPIFRRLPSYGLRGAGRLLGIGGVIVTAAELMVAGLEKWQLNQMGEILIAQDRLLRKIAQEVQERRARREHDLSVEKRARALEQAPETFDPTPVQRPTAPGILTWPLPDFFPLPSPAAVPQPGTRPVPTVRPAPGPSTLPATLPEVVPASIPAPARAPLPLPTGVPFPSPSTYPLPLPLASPSALPVPSPLTPIEALPLSYAGSSPSVGRLEITQPAAQAQAQSQRCENVQRRRRRKGKCREGFFAEYPGETTYEYWRDVDCVTRRETKRSREINNQRRRAERAQKRARREGFPDLRSV